MNAEHQLAEEKRLYSITRPLVSSSYFSSTHTDDNNTSYIILNTVKLHISQVRPVIHHVIYTCGIMGTDTHTQIFQVDAAMVKALKSVFKTQQKWIILLHMLLIHNQCYFSTSSSTECKWKILSWQLPEIKYAFYILL